VQLGFLEWADFKAFAFLAEAGPQFVFFTMNLNPDPSLSVLVREQIFARVCLRQLRRVTAGRAVYTPLYH